MRPGRPNDRLEWLEADGLGGFASGTATGIRTRRYHALLLAATRPPTGRFVLVNGFDAWVETDSGMFALTSQRYAPGIVHSDGAARIESFEVDPWPRWLFRLPDGTALEQEIFVRRGEPVVALCWRLVGGKTHARGLRLTVRPFLSGRDYHTLHKENSDFKFEPERRNGALLWRPYVGVPGIALHANGEYEHAPEWYRSFLYSEELERGLDATEDLASPGVVRWDLSRQEAVCLLSAVIGRKGNGGSARRRFAALRAAESRRRSALRGLERAAEAYLARRGEGMTIIAGYPWFADWGRDTFISLRGVCLATGRLEEAGAILRQWAGAVSEGMLPNRFPDGGEEPEYNSVDASLWYVVVVGEYLRALEGALRRVPGGERRRLRDAVEAILEGYARGTRYGIRLDTDGLLAAGVPGVQLTWMDAKVGERVITPRVGKPVEVQALWLNALWSAGAFSERWKEPLERGLAAFARRFWNEAGGCLYDVVDPWHRSGEIDSSFRPNQIFAVGGLPLPLLEGERARRLVDAVEARLWTPLGLRSLAPGEPGYAPRYEGGVSERDSAYHQGTVWPWLAGAFIEAWVRVRGGSAAAREQARSRFLAPLLAHLQEAGLGHISEIADAEPPHTARGCPFQAWSVGEALRVSAGVLGEKPLRVAPGARGGDRHRHR
jgi:predicted glycogen debranching enzyme